MKIKMRKLQDEECSSKHVICDQCGIVFTTQQDKEEHMKLEHKEGKGPTGVMSSDLFISPNCIFYTVGIHFTAIWTGLTYVSKGTRFQIMFFVYPNCC
jgi:hypothetical protein